MTARKICALAILTVILFVQEEILTFIPNVQLTFLLVLIYGGLIGIGGGTIVVLIHVILDNLVMGSFNLFIMIPMFLGLELTLLIGRLLKEKSEFIIAIFGAVCSVIYCLLFMVSNLILFGMNSERFLIKEYFLADLPFMIILAVSTVIGVLFLYKPIMKLCKKCLKKLLKEEDKTNNDTLVDDEKIDKNT